MADHKERELSIKKRARPAAPDDVWDYDGFSTWRDEVWKLIEDFADDEVRQEFLRNPPDWIVSDDLSWLDDIVLRVHGAEVDSKALLTERLLKRYKAIRALHGTATNDLGSFYEHGLRPLGVEEVQERARQLFLSGAFPELTEDHLRTAVEQVREATRQGHVYFECSERWLLELCGHYLLYGSEYLLALAANLGGTRDYRRYLKGRAPATLFVCDVPLVLLQYQTVKEFAGSALAAVFEGLQEGDDYEPEPIGAGFSIQTTLSPTCIVGHCHPTIKRDPHE